MSVFERRKSRVDEAIERQSGASREDAMGMAGDNRRADMDERRRRARMQDAENRKRGKRPLMTEEDKDDWKNVLLRMLP